MKIKKLTAVLLAALLLASMLAGCAEASKSDNRGYATEAPMMNESYSELADGIYDSSTADKAQPVTDRKLIRKITLSTETEDLDALLSAIDSKVAALGGYMENRNVYTGSRYYSDDSRRSANLTVRIPKDRMDEFVAHVDSESNVISSSESSDDVTLTYVAVQSRMNALQKEEARLLSLIDEAANLSELLELEKRLTQVRTELESVTSQLLLYDNLVDYSTVDISIQEVQKLTPKEKPGFWTRITTGFGESMRNLWKFLKELVIFLIVALPYMIPFAAIAFGIFLIVRLSVRKRRKKSAKKTPPFQTDVQ